MGKLTAVAIRAALSNPGTYQDSDGLALRVDKRGGAYWLLRLQRDASRQGAELQCRHCGRSHRTGASP